MTRPISEPGAATQPDSNKIRVLVVGLGIAGLTAAIECHRKGHHVIGFERAPASSHVGDIFSIGSNAESVIRTWDNGAISQQLDEARCAIEEIRVYDDTGKLQDVKGMAGYRVGEGYVINRSATVGTFLSYAEKLGIELRFGVTVTEYWEDEEKAGITVGGVRIAADCVIASDGIHSKARSAVVGDEIQPRKTGSAIYRSGYPAEHLLDEPGAQWLIRGEGWTDQLNHFIGKDVTVIMGTGRGGKEVYWGCMHKSFHDVSEPWLQVSDVSRVLEYIANWQIRSQLEPIITGTPHGKCFDHLVLTMDPLPSWVSAKGRIILIGDAAHPFLPTTGQGANQAIEDGATVAICLELAGQSRIPLGLQVMEKLRYQRVALIQDAGHRMLKALHNANWDGQNEEETPTMVARPIWIYNHDCQHYTYEEFDKAVEALQAGKEYVPRNTPAGGVFRIVDELKSPR